MRDLRIVHLTDVPDAASTLVDWFVAEWEPWYGPGGAGDAAADLAACRGRDDLPVCLVAVDGQGDVLGTAALKDESVGSERADGPWLAALLVGEAFRGKGVGTVLVAAIEDEARRLGFDEIFCSADASAPILERRGWEAFAATESLRGTISIYRLGGLLEQSCT